MGAAGLPLLWPCPGLCGEGNTDGAPPPAGASALCQLGPRVGRREQLFSETPPPWGLGRGLSGVNPGRRGTLKVPNLSPHPQCLHAGLGWFCLSTSSSHPPLPQAGSEGGRVAHGGGGSVLLSQLPQESLLQCSGVSLLENRPGPLLTGTVSKGACRGKSSNSV